MMKRRFFAFMICLVLAVASAQELPPVETGQFRPPSLVELVTLDPMLKLDIRYATSNNFVRQPLYVDARAFLQRPAAEALVRAHRKANAQGYGFIVYDAYRPWYVTKLFWDRFPDVRAYLADPAKGSRHNRGCAVDVSLYDLQTGTPVDMPSDFDDFSVKAHPNYAGGTARQRQARDQLLKLMESEGFTVYENEWWHFDHQDWREYPILNVKFRDIR